MRLRKLRMIPITTNAMPPMPMPRPMSPSRIGPPGISSSPRLAASAASSAFGSRAHRHRRRDVPSATKTSGLPPFGQPPAPLARGALGVARRSRARSPSAARHTASAHSPMAMSHRTTKPAGAPGHRLHRTRLVALAAPSRSDHDDDDPDQSVDDAVGDVPRTSHRLEDRAGLRFAGQVLRVRFHALTLDRAHAGERGA